MHYKLHGKLYNITGTRENIFSITDYTKHEITHITSRHCELQRNNVELNTHP